MEYSFEKSKLYNYLGDYLVGLLIEHKAYIAGGTITSLFCNREINDIDVYFRSKEDCTSFIGEIYNNSCLMTHTNKATLFIRGEGNTPVKLQLIHFGFFENVAKIFEKFDYTVCMGAFDFVTEEFVLHSDFIKDNCSRILKFNSNTAYPIISFLRIQKYEEKGYKISKSELIRVLLTCLTLNLNSYEELGEQMGGMYGINYDKIFKGCTDFSLESAIEKIKNLHVNDDYFDKRIEYTAISLEQLVKNIDKDATINSTNTLFWSPNELIF